jgi:hypothetical protein
MNLLTEDRISDAFEKYRDNPVFSKDIFDVIVQGSANIAGNHKYLDWILSNWIKSREENPEMVTSSKDSAQEVINAVATFDKVRNILDIKNLYDYKSVEQLFQTLTAVESRQRREVNSRKDAQKVFENDQFVIMVPETKEASCYYGAGTKWCTAASDNNSHFNTYKKSGELYYIIDKTKPTSDPTYKVALNKKLTGEEDFWNAVDKMITDKVVIDSIVNNEELMKTVRVHFQGVHGDRVAQAEKERKQREQERAAQESERRRLQRERIARLGAEAQVRRENNEWEDYDLAHALMTYLVEQGEWEGDRKEEIYEKIDDLRNDMENDPEVIENPDGERAQEYGEDLENLEEELENAEDVYELIPEPYDTDEYAAFEYAGKEWLIATEDGADEYAYERVESLIDDIGYEGFNEGFVQGHIDGDKVAEYHEQWFREDVDDEPDSYLDEDIYGDDMELTREAKEEIEKIKDAIADFNEELEETDTPVTKELLEDKIQELESEIEDLQEDEDSYEFTEEAKERYVENRMEDVRYDPVAFLRDYGIEDQIENFIDQESFIEDVISSDGRGHTIASYDGGEDEVEYDGEYYYIYRMN